MTPITTVIVDFPATALELARLEVRRDPAFSLIAELDSARTGVPGIRSLAPQLALVGSVSARSEACRMVEELAAGGQTLSIIVATDGANAAEAYAAGALDYLRLPVDPQRLRRALSRAKRRIRHTPRGAQSAGKKVSVPPALDPRRLVLTTTDGDIRVFRMEDIEYCQATAKHVRLHTLDVDFTVACSLRTFEARLDPRHFVRVHRSTVINVTRLAEIKPRAYGDCVLHLESGDTVMLSRRYRHRLLTLLATVHHLKDSPLP